jgi:hypothetical protein
MRYSADADNHAVIVQGFRFPQGMISHAVWLDFRFSLSFRDVEDLLAGLLVGWQGWRHTSPGKGCLRRRDRECHGMRHGAREDQDATHDLILLWGWLVLGMLFDVAVHIHK